MDTNVNVAQRELQMRAAVWLRREAPGPLPVSLEDRFPILRDWHRKLYAAGWVGLGWPLDYGGQGGSHLDQIVFNQELARAKAPPPFGMIGLDVIGQTILTFGTDEQKRRFVPPLLSGAEFWCQGFSEPNAGSDLASLETRAVIDGASLVVSGQKVWTSHAQYAHWCALLARTDPHMPRHQGISYLLVDMASPGVTVSPLTEINGDHEFSAVYFDNVRIPRKNILGQLGDGWKLAMHTLAQERGPFVLRRQVELRAAMDDLLAELRRMALDPSVTRRVGETEAYLDVLEARSIAIATSLQAGDPGSESSIDKLLMAEVDQRVFGLALDSLGAERTITESNTRENARWIHDYLHSRAASVYGGSGEIQRNIIAQRVLGLPRDRGQNESV